MQKPDVAAIVAQGRDVNVEQRRGGSGRKSRVGVRGAPNSVQATTSAGANLRLQRAEQRGGGGNTGLEFFRGHL
jgi:hypothetical protein